MLDESDASSELEALRLSCISLVNELKKHYAETGKRDERLNRDWGESKELLEHKKWTMEEQVKILEKEILATHKKIDEIKPRRKTRYAHVRKVYKQVLSEFYFVHNPEKIKNLDEVLDHFHGRENEMMATIKQRYDVEVSPESFSVHGVTLTENARDSVLEGLDMEAEKLWDQVAELEDLVLRSTYELEKLKGELYFPQVDGWSFKQGFDGVYIACNDFWLEDISAKISLSVHDRSNEPRFTVSVGGTEKVAKSTTGTVNFDQDESSPKSALPSGGAKKGGVVSFRLDKFGLYGEAGTKVPTLNMTQIVVLVEFQLVVPVYFKKKIGWRASKEFEFRILKVERKITGSSIYVPKSLLKLVLNQILPGVIRTAIMKIIPVELGTYLSQRYETFSKERQGASEAMHLDVDLVITGGSMDLATLDVDISTPPPDNGTDKAANDAGNARQFLQLSHEQAKTFVRAQKEMHDLYLKYDPYVSEKDKKLWPSKPLTNASALVEYYRRHAMTRRGAIITDEVSQQNTEISRGDRKGSSFFDDRDDAASVGWRAIMDTWQQFTDRFARVHNIATLNIRRLFRRVDELTQKPLTYHVELSNAHLRVSVDRFVDMLYRFLLRSARELHNENSSNRVHLKKSLPKQLEDIHEWYEETKLPIKYIKQTVNTVVLSFTGVGQSGEFKFVAEDVKFTGPVKLLLPFESKYYPPNHFVVDTKIHEENGSFDIHLLVSPTMDPLKRVEGSMIQVALTRLHTGIYFDVRNYLCSKMLEFKNSEMENMISGEKPSTPTRIRRKRSSSVPSMPVSVSPSSTTHHVSLQKHSYSRDSSATANTDEEGEDDEDDEFVDHNDDASSEFSPHGASMDRFMRYFFQQLGEENADERDGLSILGATFAQDATNAKNFLFDVDTHHLSQMKASAQRVQLTGRVGNICGFVYDWVDHAILKQEKAQEDSSTPTVIEMHRAKRLFAKAFTKYVDKPETKFSFRFRVLGGVRLDQLVGSLVHDFKQDDAPIVMIEGRLNLLEFIHDIVHIVNAARNIEI